MHGHLFKIMRIHIATDGSEYSYEAARQILKLTHDPNHHVAVLYVIPALSIGRRPEYLQYEIQQEGLVALNTVQTIFAQAAIDVELILKQGDPADTILDVASDGRYDLLVIGQRGLGGYREMLLGSVSKEVISKSHCSVYISK